MDSRVLMWNCENEHFNYVTMDEQDIDMVMGDPAWIRENPCRICGSQIHREYYDEPHSLTVYIPYHLDEVVRRKGWQAIDLETLIDHLIALADTTAVKFSPEGEPKYFRGEDPGMHLYANLVRETDGEAVPYQVEMAGYIIYPSLAYHFFQDNSVTLRDFATMAAPFVEDALEVLFPCERGVLMDIEPGRALSATIRNYDDTYQVFTISLSENGKVLPGEPRRRGLRLDKVGPLSFQRL